MIGAPSVREQSHDHVIGLNSGCNDVVGGIGRDAPKLVFWAPGSDCGCFAILTLWWAARPVEFKGPVGDIVRTSTRGFQAAGTARFQVTHHTATAGLSTIRQVNVRAIFGTILNWSVIDCRDTLFLKS